jgi:hypothetical protein
VDEILYIYLTGGMSRLVCKLAAGAAVAAFMLPQLGFAEQKAAQPPAPSPITPKFTSGVSVGEEYLDNIYAARTNKVSDWIWIVNPFANLRLRGENGEINVGGNATIGRYATHKDENYSDYSAYANGRYNFSPALSLSGGAAYDHQHESRSSPDARPSVTPTIYNVTRAFGAALVKLDQGSIRVGGTFDHFDYDNVARVGGGTVTNDDRDRDVVTVGTRIGHSIDNMNELFGMFSYDSRDYRLPVDDFGYQKDSSGIRFSGGWHHRMSSTLDGEVYAGGIYQRYSDPRFGTVFVPDFGGRVRWTGIPGTTVTAKLERTIQETDMQGASGYVQTVASIDVVHWIRPNLRINGAASYYLDQFNAITRVDQIQSYGIGIRKYFTPHFYVGADFSRTTRDSTDLDYNYIDSRAMIRAGLIQEPAYKDEDFKKPEVPSDIQGRFYVGFQTGLTNLETKLQGPRGSAGTLQADCSPLTVLSSQYEEVLKSINTADSVSVDASGRLVLTTDGVASAIDSPLANLALYVELLNTGTITGVTDPSKFATSISYLVDGTKTTADMLSAASFLAAASDKAGSLTIDKVVDMNTILGITGTLPSQDPTSTLKYVDYTTFNYDRQSVYDGVTVTVLVKQADGSYLPTAVNVYDAVFSSTNYTSTDGGVDGFAQAADDARAVIEYVHDNSVPGT